MSKGVYIGVAGKARKVKNIYIGVGGKARKVKKAYIGVAGKARLIYEDSPFPLNLIPIDDASLWTLNDLSANGSYNGSAFGAHVTADGWLWLQSSNGATASATFKEALDFSTAGEIVITYSQNWRIKPRISLVNVSTGKTDFTMTATNTGQLTDLWTAKLDVSTANSKYYLTLDTVDYYGDMTLYVKSLNITKRS